MNKEQAARASAIALSAALVGITPTAVAGLVGLYQFNESGNLALDTSGAGNDGTNAGASYSTAGHDGGAASFSGSEHISIGTSVSPTSMPQMTWGAWVRATVTGEIQTVLSSDNGFYDRDIGIDRRSGTSPSYDYDPSWSAFAGSSGGVLRSGISPGSDWVFLAAVYDESSSSMTFYVDDWSMSADTSFDDSFGYFYIGSNPGFGESFSGLIDDVFVYDEALSATQIAAVRAGNFSLVPIPSALWLFGAGLASLLSVGAKHRTSVDLGSSRAAGRKRPADF